MEKKIEMTTRNNKKYFLTEVETLEDLKAFCETRYYQDDDVAFFWKMFERGQTMPFCLNEIEFKKYYLKGGD